MKCILVIGTAVLASALGGCVVVPVGPPVAYIGPHAVVAAPVYVLRGPYRERWGRY